MKQEAPVSPAVHRALTAYRDLLIRWNSRVNLVADAEPMHVWERHILDSLQIVQYLPAASSSVLDVGSGAGFPGLVIAIANTGRPITLVEVDKRKAAFLLEAVRTLGLTNVTVIAKRIEETDLQADVITARAVAPVARLLALTAARLRPGGIAIFLKGRSAEDELTAALMRWKLRVERFRSCTDEHGVILRLSEITPLARTS